MERTLGVLQKAAERAKAENLPLLLASTTGKTALQMLQILGDSPVPLKVIAHDPRRVSQDSTFDPEVLTKLKTRGDRFLEDYAPFLPPLRVTRWLEKVFKLSSWSFQEKRLEKKYGTGGKVCFLIAERFLKAGMIVRGEKVIALGGVQGGVDTALLLEVYGQKPGEIRMIESIAQPKG